MLCSVVTSRPRPDGEAKAVSIYEFEGLQRAPVTEATAGSIIALSGIVAKITKNYIDRTFHGSKERPMYSAFPDVQREQERS